MFYSDRNGMEGFWLPAQEWRCSIVTGTEWRGSGFWHKMEVFYSDRNGMEGFWLPAQEWGCSIVTGTEWRDSSCRHRNGRVL